MLVNHTLDKLRSLRLPGFVKGFEEQIASRESYEELSFDDRLAVLADRESLERENHLLLMRLGKVKFKDKVELDEIKPSAARGLDKTTLKSIATCEWLKQKRNVIITGPSGAGKSYLAQGMAHKACLNGNTARYFRKNMLQSDLTSAKADGRYRRLIESIGKINVLVIDDWFLSAITEEQQKDLFELIEERHKKNSTIFTSQNPISSWHALMPNPAIADAILDRIVHSAIRIELKGDSQRKDFIVDEKKNTN